MVPCTAPSAWAYVPETCRAKNTSIKLPSCIKLEFHIISWGRCTVKQPSILNVCYGEFILDLCVCSRHVKKPFPKAFQFFILQNQNRILVHVCHKFSTIVLSCFPVVTFDLNALHIVPIQVSVISSVLNVMFKPYMAVNTNVITPTLCYILIQFWI